jgi:hypothetical protein
MTIAFSAARLRQSTSFLRLTGVSITVFDDMLTQLRGDWDAEEARKIKLGRPSDIGGLEDHVLIMLIYYRCYVTQEFLGFFYQVHKSAICRALKRIEAHAKPRFGVKNDPQLSGAEAEALIFDCTEQPIYRPGKDAIQKEHYSGKKKRHTRKTEISVTAAGRIASISPSYPGSVHDLTVRRAGPRLAGETHLYGDSAYQGYDKEHANIDYPYKKPKGGELNAEEKEYNAGLSRFRVKVEHRIGRCKRFRIVSDRFRNPRDTHHTKASIVAGMANLNAGFPAC